MNELTYVNLLPGDAAPWFQQRCVGNPRFAFDTMGGRYIVLCFFGSAADPKAQAALKALYGSARHLLDDDKISAFGVTIDPQDEQRVQDAVPGIRIFWDFDRKVSRLYGAAPTAPEATSDGVNVRQFWLVLDPTLRVMAGFPIGDEGTAALLRFVESLPDRGRFFGYEIQAPVLFIPNVFERELCDHLVGLYDQHGGAESGFMRDVGGKTVQLMDRSHKSRRDHEIDDKDLINRLQSRIIRRVVPEIKKVHSFAATRMERYIVSCYAAEDEGHFRPHRDNTTLGTAHRRFAVSINLSSDFDGGELGFPEYSSRSFKAPLGGAIVFSGALLHSVSRVTRGRRYAFLPFLYDDAAAKIREENAKHLEGDLANYKAQAAGSASRSGPGG